MLCTIIGAGSGLGAALARRFADEGYQIALVARSLDTMAPTVAVLRDAGKNTQAFAADASSPVSLQNAFEAIQKWAGDTDVLIYNAAAMVPGPVLEFTPEQVQSEMATNLGGAITAVRNTLPAMRARKSGTIIFTGGGSSFEPYPGWASLAVGKAALRAYSIALHKELAPESVHVANIAICGFIEPVGPFDPSIIADNYWKIHQEKPGSFTREVMYLPEGADPFYGDVTGTYRAFSKPIGSTERAA